MTAPYGGIIIGIDCATQQKNTGPAAAVIDNERLMVREVRCASAQSSAASIVALWIEEAKGNALLALDAPLGWPIALGSALALHRAGEPLTVEANLLFRRQTDREIYARLGKSPLDVGADRIARTAHSALALLDELRRKTSRPIPLAWSPGEGAARLSAIEVYPAATRISLGLPLERGSVAGLGDRLEFVDGAVPASEHEGDAVLCAIAASEFLTGRAIGPANPDRETVQREGWIWAGQAAGVR